jgi:hypothetical protein
MSANPTKNYTSYESDSDSDSSTPSYTAYQSGASSPSSSGSDDSWATWDNDLGVVVTSGLVKFKNRVASELQHLLL